jgi:hypothetical protein
VTYLTVVAGFIAALIFGRWSDEIELCFKVILGALAIIGLLAFAYDFCVRTPHTPHALWISLKERTDGRIAIVSAFMSDGARLRNDIETGQQFIKNNCEQWEKQVYDWLAENMPDFKEQFRLELVPGGQAWSPNVPHQEAAHWMNTLDRRLLQLKEVLDYLRTQLIPASR